MPTFSDQPCPLSVSVIIPVRFSGVECRRQRTLLEALESVSSQTLQPLEVIIVASGVIRNPESLEDYCRAPYRIIYEGDPSNPAHARNVGVKASRGDLVAFLDSDDLWAPQYLEFMVLTLNTSDTIAAYSMAFTTSSEQLVARTYFPVEQHQATCLLIRNFIHAASAFAIRREAFLSLGGFREDLEQTEDLEFYVRIARDHRIAVLPLFLVHRRLGNDSLTQRARLRCKDIANAHDAISSLIDSDLLPVAEYGGIARMLRVALKCGFASRQQISCLTYITMYAVRRLKVRDCIIGLIKQRVAREELVQAARRTLQVAREAEGIVHLSGSAFADATGFSNSALIALGVALQRTAGPIAFVPITTSRFCDDRIPLSVVAAACFGVVGCVCPVKIGPRALAEAWQRPRFCITGNRTLVQSLLERGIRTVLFSRTKSDAFVRRYETHPMLRLITPDSVSSEIEAVVEWALSVKSCTAP